MESNQFPGGEDSRPSRIVSAGRYIGKYFGNIRRELNEARQQLSGADLNPHEGMLRSSVAPAEYLPQAPDFVPLHDDTIIDRPS